DRARHARGSTAAPARGRAHRRSPKHTTPHPTRGRSGSIHRTSPWRSPRQRRRRQSRRPLRSATPGQSGRDRSRYGRKVRSPPTEPALARRETLYCLGEIALGKVRPQLFDEYQLGISRLPQQEVRKSLFARGPYEQVELRKAVSIELRFEGGLLDLRRIDGASRRLAGKRPCRRGDFGARAVVQRDDQGQPRIARSMVDRALQPLHQLRPERRIFADQPELDALLVERGKLAIEIEAHQAGKIGNFLVAPLP